MVAEAHKCEKNEDKQQKYMQLTEMNIFNF